MSDSSSENNPIADSVGSVWHQISLRLDRELCSAGTDLSADQFRVLTILWNEDGQSQQLLAEQLGRDRSAITRMVDTLEKKSLVERRACPSDARVKHIFLAKKGKQIKESANLAAAGAVCGALKGFSELEKKQLQKMLSRMSDNLKGNE